MSNNLTITPPRNSRRNTAPSLSPRVPSTSSHPLAIAIPGASPGARTRPQIPRGSSIYARLARGLSYTSTQEISSNGLLDRSDQGTEDEERGDSEAASSWAVVGAWQGRVNDGDVGEALGEARRGNKLSAGPDSIDVSGRDGSTSIRTSEDDEGTILEVDEEEEEDERSMEGDQLILPRRISEEVPQEDDFDFASTKEAPPFPSPAVRNVIKCVTSYVVAELFTFMPALSELIATPLGNERVMNAHLYVKCSLLLSASSSILTKRSTAWPQSPSF